MATEPTQAQPASNGYYPGVNAAVLSGQQAPSNGPSAAVQVYVNAHNAAQQQSQAQPSQPAQTFAYSYYNPSTGTTVNPQAVPATPVPGTPTAPQPTGYYATQGVNIGNPGQPQMVAYNYPENQPIEPGKVTSFEKPAQPGGVNFFQNPGGWLVEKAKELPSVTPQRDDQLGTLPPIAFFPSMSEPVKEQLLQVPTNVVVGYGAGYAATEVLGAGFTAVGSYAFEHGATLAEATTVSKGLMTGTSVVLGGLGVYQLATTPKEQLAPALELGAGMLLGGMGSEAFKPGLRVNDVYATGESAPMRIQTETMYGYPRTLQASGSQEVVAYGELFGKPGEYFGTTEYRFSGVETGKGTQVFTAAGIQETTLAIPRAGEPSSNFELVMGGQGKYLDQYGGFAGNPERYYAGKVPQPEMVTVGKQEFSAALNFGESYGGFLTDTGAKQFVGSESASYFRITSDIPLTKVTNVGRSVEMEQPFSFLKAKESTRLYEYYSAETTSVENGQVSGSTRSLTANYVRNVDLQRQEVTFGNSGELEPVGPVSVKGRTTAESFNKELTFSQPSSTTVTKGRELFSQLGLLNRPEYGGPKPNALQTTTPLYMNIPVNKEMIPFNTETGATTKTLQVSNARLSSQFFLQQLSKVGYGQEFARSSLIVTPISTQYQRNTPQRELYQNNGLGAGLIILPSVLSRQNQPRSQQPQLVPRTIQYTYERATTRTNQVQQLSPRFDLQLKQQLDLKFGGLLSFFNPPVQPPTRTTKIPGFIPNLGTNIMKGLGFGGKKKKYQYSPNLTAAFLNIKFKRGSPTKGFTGLETTTRGI